MVDKISVWQNRALVKFLEDRLLFFHAEGRNIDLNILEKELGKYKRIEVLYESIPNLPLEKYDIEIINHKPTQALFIHPAQTEGRVIFHVPKVDKAIVFFPRDTKSEGPYLAKKLLCPRCGQDSITCTYNGSAWGSEELFDHYGILCTSCDYKAMMSENAGTHTEDWGTCCPLCGVGFTKHKKP
jgi:hypothetical protein